MVRNSAGLSVRTRILFILLSALVALMAAVSCVAAPPAQPSTPRTTTNPTMPLTSVSPSSTGVYAIATVTRVVDGDTIDVNLDGRVQRVRYIGINAPESVDPNRPVQPYGLEASAKNKELVEGQTVRLEKDVSETDQYGRLLRYVYVGDLMVNAELVRLGYAQAITYPPDVKHQDYLRQLQAEAREAGRGLWGLTPSP